MDSYLVKKRNYWNRPLELNHVFKICMGLNCFGSYKTQYEAALTHQNVFPIHISRRIDSRSFKAALDDGSISYERVERKKSNCDFTCPILSEDFRDQSICDVFGSYCKTRVGNTPLNRFWKSGPIEEFRNIVPC